MAKVEAMLYLIFKAALPGIVIAAVSEIAKRSPPMGALLASLPLVAARFGVKLT